MKNLVFILVSLFAFNSFSKGNSKGKPPHREHEAHQHGAGTLGIAFEDNKGRLEFKIPGESVVGFEYTPKTDKDKKTKENQLAKLDSEIANMVVFDSALKCQITKDKVEVVKDEKESAEAHAEHSDVIASFNVACEKDPVGTKITFNFQKQFPKIHDLDVQIITGSVQKSVEAKKNGTTVDLKP